MFIIAITTASTVAIGIGGVSIIIRDCLPQIIATLDIPEAEKQAAFRARRFAPDRTVTYSIEELLIDLAGPILKGIQ